MRYVVNSLSPILLYYRIAYTQDGRCKEDELLNLDLCECWDKDTVDTTTCRTKKEKDLAELREEQLKKYDILDVLGKFRFIIYSLYFIT